MSEVITLMTPITVGEETIKEITLRRPTVADTRKVGRLPYTFGAGGAIVPDTDTASKYVSICSALPPSTIDKLDVTDFQTLVLAIVGFFMVARTDN